MRSAVQCSLAESKVRAIFVVIRNILAEQPLEMAFVDGDDVVQ